MIRLENVGKIYRNNDHHLVALDGLNITFPNNGLVAILGPSGCGKTTLLNILGGLDHPTSGIMYVHEHDTSDFDDARWDSYRNQEIGFIFQNYYLIPHLSVYDNVSLSLQMSGNHKDMDERVTEILKKVGLLDKKNARPSTLSGGQMQRAAIARAIINDPKIILADEPTGALDSTNAIQILHILKEIAKDRLVVMVTHNQELAHQYADRIIEMFDGHVVKDNSTTVYQEKTSDENGLTGGVYIDHTAEHGVTGSVYKDYIGEQTLTDGVYIDHSAEHGMTGSVYKDYIDEQTLTDGVYKANTASDQEKKSEEAPTKVKIPFKTAVKWGVRNLWNKKLRSLLTILAGGLGIIGMGLILSMTSGVKSYINKAQESALGKYPIIVSSYPRNSSEGNKNELEEFPNTDYVIIEKGNVTIRDHLNQMPDDFKNYMTQMNDSLYSICDSNSWINFNMITKREQDYRHVASSYFTQMVKNKEFVNEQYTCLLGRLPQAFNELALVVDTYNRIDASLLQSLGFDTDEETITFDYLLREKEYRIIDNNDYYIKVDDKNCYYAYGSDYYEELYTESTVSLKIVGIIREKQNSVTPLYEPGILYTPELGDYIVSQALESEIVKEQIQSGLTKDVFTGLPFEDRISGQTTYSKEYLYEQRMIILGTEAQITQFYFYTDSFENRLAIQDYIDDYQISDDAPIIVRTYDYIELVTNEFSLLVALFSNILLVFSIVSIAVSAILIGILIYISVLERKREIGLLRSLGARRKDVASMFLIEASLLGICLGILGVLGAAILTRPVSGIVHTLLAQYNTEMLSNVSIDLSSFQWWCAPILLIVGVLTTLIAGMIPAIIASKKRPADSLRDEG